MTQYTLTTLTAIRLVASGSGPCLIINRDLVNQILIGDDSSVVTVGQNAVTIVDPLGTIAVTGDRDVWAVAALNTANVDVQEDATFWTPSPLQIAQQEVANLPGTLIDDLRNIFGSLTYPIMYVGNLPYVMLVLSNFNKGYSVQINWFADAAGTVLLETSAIEALAGDIVRQPLKTQSLYMQVAITIQAAQNTTNSIIKLWQTPAFTSMLVTSGSFGNISQDGVAVNNGVSRLDDITEVRDCWAFWSGNPLGAAAWFMKLFGVQKDGVTKVLLDEISNGGGGFTPRLVHLPPMHIQIETHNGDAAPRNFTIMLSKFASF